jgi:hypothetical protein
MADTPKADYARAHGYQVHLGRYGWFVVKPNEWCDGQGRNKRGVSLGDLRRRQSFRDQADAWRWAAEYHWRKAKRRPAHQRHDGCHPIIV